MTDYLDKAREAAKQVKIEKPVPAEADTSPARCPHCGGLAFWVGQDGSDHCERCDPPAGTTGTTEVAWRYDFTPDPDVQAILEGRTFAFNENDFEPLPGRCWWAGRNRT